MRRSLYLVPIVFGTQAEAVVATTKFEAKHDALSFRKEIAPKTSTGLASELNLGKEQGRPLFFIRSTFAWNKSLT